MRRKERKTRRALRHTLGLPRWEFSYGCLFEKKSTGTLTQIIQDGRFLCLGIGLFDSSTETHTRLVLRGCRLEIIMDQDPCKSDLKLLF